MLNRDEFFWQAQPIDSWAEFHRVVKRPGRALLARLGDYVDSVLVAGCQRSGTTALTRLLKRSEVLADYGFGPDDELDGALLLAGYVNRFTSGRHCFQTTYLNDHFPEYYDHERFKLVWLLREPASVVYSMLHNWRRSALDRLYEACGRGVAESFERRSSSLTPLLGLSRLDKACASYVAKTEQTAVLKERLGAKIMIVDYDDLVVNKAVLLPQIFDFVGLEFKPELLGHLHAKSVHRGKRLSDREARRVEETCRAVYERNRRLTTIGAGRARA